jgi:quinol monooxygenase YgiN
MSAGEKSGVHTQTVRTGPDCYPAPPQGKSGETAGDKDPSMIITTIKIKVPPDKRQEILQTINALTGPIRREPGCRSCDLYLDTENADAFLLVQEWTGQEDFERHVRAAAFSTLLGALTLLHERPDVRINTVTNAAGMEKIKAVRAA